MQIYLEYMVRYVPLLLYAIGGIKFRSYLNDVSKIVLEEFLSVRSMISYRSCENNGLCGTYRTTHNKLLEASTKREITQLP